MRLLQQGDNRWHILYRTENFQRMLKLAESMSLYGEQYSWYFGSKSTSASFDATCCSDMRVFFFYPREVSSGELRTMKGFGLSEEPLLETSFYADLTAKSLAAVSKMKRGNCERLAGSTHLIVQLATGRSCPTRSAASTPGTVRPPPGTSTFSTGCRTRECLTSGERWSSPPTERVT